MSGRPSDSVAVIVEEMRACGRYNGPPPNVTDWADRLAALAPVTAASNELVQCPCCGAPCVLGEQVVRSFTEDEFSETVDTFTYANKDPQP